MLPEIRSKLRALLLKHEGFKQFLYTDSRGVPSLGIGRNVRDRGVTMEEALVLLDDDLIYFTHKLDTLFPWYANLSPNRQVALVDMAFNLGVNGLMLFRHMLESLAAGRYDMAANAMLSSAWAAQVEGRAVELAEIIRTGEL